MNILNICNTIGAISHYSLLTASTNMASRHLNPALYLQFKIETPRPTNAAITENNLANEIGIATGIHIEQPNISNKLINNQNIKLLSFKIDRSQFKTLNSQENIAKLQLHGLTLHQNPSLKNYCTVVIRNILHHHREIFQNNPALFLCESNSKIRYTGINCPPNSKFAYLALCSPDDAEEVAKHGFNISNQHGEVILPHRLSVYVQTHVMQCKCCYQWNDHNTLQCKFNNDTFRRQQCSHCSLFHPNGYKNCANLDSPPKCLNCGGQHIAISRSCPYAKEAAKQVRQKYKGPSNPTSHLPAPNIPIQNAWNRPILEYPPAHEARYQSNRNGANSQWSQARNHFPSERDIPSRPIQAPINTPTNFPPLGPHTASHTQYPPPVLHAPHAPINYTQVHPPPPTKSAYLIPTSSRPPTPTILPTSIGPPTPKETPVTRIELSLLLATLTKNMIKIINEAKLETLEAIKNQAAKIAHPTDLDLLANLIEINATPENITQSPTKMPEKSNLNTIFISSKNLEGGPKTKSPQKIADTAIIMEPQIPTSDAHEMAPPALAVPDTNVVEKKDDQTRGSITDIPVSNSKASLEISTTETVKNTEQNMSPGLKIPDITNEAIVVTYDLSKQFDCSNIDKSPQISASTPVQNTLIWNKNAHTYPEEPVFSPILNKNQLSPQMSQTIKTTHKDRNVKIPKILGQTKSGETSKLNAKQAKCKNQIKQTKIAALNTKVRSKGFGYEITFKDAKTRRRTTPIPIKPKECTEISLSSPNVKITGLPQIESYKDGDITETISPSLPHMTPIHAYNISKTHAQDPYWDYHYQNQQALSTKTKLEYSNTTTELDDSNDNNNSSSLEITEISPKATNAKLSKKLNKLNCKDFKKSEKPARTVKSLSKKEQKAMLKNKPVASSEIANN